MNKSYKWYSFQTNIDYFITITFCRVNLKELNRVPMLINSV